MFRKWILCILLIIVSLSMPALMKRFTCGFKLAKLQLDSHRNFQFCPVTDEILSILGQKFKYFARGAQCYAFLSEDEKYILKLFRFDRHHSKAKIASFFQACKEALLVKQETGLVYMHMQKGQFELPTLH